MVSLQIDNAVILGQKDILEHALSTNPKTQKALQKLIRQVIREARANVVATAKGTMGNDPRGSAQSIRTAVYKKILGANINIYDSYKAHGRTDYEPPRTLRQGQRGGNRRPRSVRTNKVMHYGPLDRGFILRFQNDGTKKRAISRLMEFKRPKGGSSFKWVKDASKYGNRGSITGKHWFRNKGEQSLIDATRELSNLIDSELENILSKKK